MGERTENDAYWCNISMEYYLGDTGRTSGGVLSMVADEPEAYGLYLRGKLEDKPSAAKAQGSLVHFMSAERGGSDLLRERFAFYPSQNDAMVPEMRLKPGTKTVYEPTGNKVPQDGSPEAAFKPVNRKTKEGKRIHAEFMEAHRGKIVVWPQSMPKVNGMTRSLRDNKLAAAFLSEGGEPEVTGHWTCPITGEQMRIRPDVLWRRPDALEQLALRVYEAMDDHAEAKWLINKLRSGAMVELKTVTTKGEKRLDIGHRGFVRSKAQEGWPRKDATLHDGFREIEGRFGLLIWIIVEAREEDARTCVLISDPTDPMNGYTDLGRYGDGEVPGYIELCRKAQAMRESGDFRAECVRRPVVGWRLPKGMAEAVEMEKNAAGEDELDGGESMEVVSYG
jgi:hypothetical protein